MNGRDTLTNSVIADGGRKELGDLHLQQKHYHRHPRSYLGFYRRPGEKNFIKILSLALAASNHL